MYEIIYDICCNRYFGTILIMCGILLSCWYGEQYKFIKVETCAFAIVLEIFYFAFFNRDEDLFFTRIFAIFFIILFIAQACFLIYKVNNEPEDLKPTFKH